MNVALLLSVALGVSAPKLKHLPKTDTGIVGQWVLESSTFGGKAAKIANDLRYEFTADGQWIIRREGAEVKALPRTFKVDAKANPATIDVTYQKPDGGPAQQPGMLGIYKIEGDTLTICYAPGSADRPTTFDPADGARVAVLVLKRAKKK
jgi:uncharacterized protein (TIGR03067 family)